MTLSFTLNNTPVTVETDPLTRLLDLLRDDFGLTSVKEGCGEGECGACAVMVDGRVVNSCITPAAVVAGASVLTVDGIRETEQYRVIEKAFADAGGVQCGFCTPGFVMATCAMLNENERPTELEIRHGLSGNLCRCTGYNMIVDAVRLASERLHGR